MFKVFEKKLIITFVSIATVGGGCISMKTLPIFYNAHTATNEPQASNVKKVTVDSKKEQKTDTVKDSNSLSDVNDSSDDSRNNNDEISKQETVISKSEKSSSNNDATKQIDASSPLKEANSNVSTEKQENTNTTIEVQAPTFHYDRTTSIYANDNITLLRVEYYVNNKLTYYSEVVQFDAATKSYIEKIYQCNRETNIDPLVRTDVYVNGNLTKSY